MKKIISIALAFVMVFTLCMPTLGVFATEEITFDLYGTNGSLIKKTDFNYVAAGVGVQYSDPNGLLLYGKESSKGKSALATFDGQDWSGYTKLNLELKAYSSSYPTAKFMVCLYGDKNNTNTKYWGTQPKVEVVSLSPDNWATVSIDIPGKLAYVTETSEVLTSNVPSLSHVEGMKFGSIEGYFYIQSIWLSGPATSDTPPVAQGSDLDDGATDVPVGLGSIVITYDKDITSAELGSVSLTNQDTGEQVDGVTAVPVEDTLTVSFGELDYETTYVLTVGDFIRTFTTEALPLAVETCTIDDNAKDVPIDLGSISITYNQNIESAGLESQVTLKQSTGDQVSGVTATATGSTLSVNFGDLAYSTNYELKVGENTWNFTTEANLDDVAKIKARWIKSLVGDESNNTTDDKAYLDYVDEYCQIAGNKSTTPSGTSAENIRQQFVYIEDMAKGYATKGSTYYKNEVLLDRIKTSLKVVLGDSYYNSTNFKNGENWYNWQIASPHTLMNTLILLEDELKEEPFDSNSSIMVKALTAIKSFVYDMDNTNSSIAKMYAEGGSNVLYYVKIRTGVALLENDTDDLQAFLERAEDELDYVVYDENAEYNYNNGFYEDGTYIYHTKHFHNGLYGTEHYKLIAELAAFTKDTTYAFKNEDVARLFEIYKTAFEPLIYNGNVIAMANGRAPYDEDDLTHEVMQGLLNLTAAFDNDSYYKAACEEAKPKIKDFYEKNGVTYESTKYDRYMFPPAGQLYKELKTILDDDTVPAVAPYKTTKIYTNGDKVVHNTGSFMVAISMSSSRVYNYESISDYNMGWYMGSGMQYIYLPEALPKDSSYRYSNWLKLADPLKRPGTTVDTQSRTAEYIQQGKEYLSTKNFVGGVALGNTGVAAMDQDSYNNYKATSTSTAFNSTLTAKKSWFMFDDEVVSLGADIDATNGETVRTYIDNRAYEKVYVNGSEESLTSGNLVQIPATYLNYDNEIGYVFPNGEDIYLNRNSNYQFAESWISHGVEPNDAKYAYITLPGKTSEETAAYAANSGVEVLSNTSLVQAVKDNSTKTTGYVFWSAEAECDNIKATTPCTVVKKEDGNLVTMAVSDPTHKLGEIKLTLVDTVAVLEGTPANVTFEHDNGNTVITINSSDCSGKGYEFSYRVYTEAYVKSLELTDDGANYRADVTIANPSTTAANVTVYLAIYDSKKEKLLNVIAEEVTAAVNSEATRSILLPKNGVPKVFVWNDLVPLCESGTLSN